MSKLGKCFKNFFFFIHCRTVTMKDLESGQVRVIYEAIEVISGLKIPIVRDPKVTYCYLILHFDILLLLFLKYSLLNFCYYILQNYCYVEENNVMWQCYILYFYIGPIFGEWLTKTDIFDNLFFHFYTIKLDLVSYVGSVGKWVSSSVEWGEQRNPKQTMGKSKWSKECCWGKTEEALERESINRRKLGS